MANIIFAADGLKPSKDADITIGGVGESIAYGDAVYQSLLTGLWWTADANGPTAASRVCGGLALNAAVPGQKLVVVMRDLNLETGVTTGQNFGSGQVIWLSGVKGKLEVFPVGLGFSANVVGVTLSDHAVNLQGVAGGEVTALSVTYPGEVFVSNVGSDASGGVGNINFPYYSLNAAAAELEAAYPSRGTTIWLMTDTQTNLDFSASLDRLLTHGLTLRSYDATVRGTGPVSLGSKTGAQLTLIKVGIPVLEKQPQNAWGVISAGLVTGDAETVIGEIKLSGGNGVPGDPAQSGGTVVGNNGSSGADGDPPASGESGGGADASGLGGGTGYNGGRAWNLTLAGAGGVVGAIIGIGGAGGVGGTGGSGGNAAGGTGGPGGNHTGTGDGGSGGSGGSAAANGGGGGGGGMGAAGSTVYVGNWTVMTSTLTGGIGGEAGMAGGAGGAVGGVGAAGGAGSGGGAEGAAGSDGSGSAEDGSAGSAGPAGVDGVLA